MATRAVHWYEGMFLRPQHLQAAQRYAEHQSQRGAKWGLHYNWGLRSIMVDREALANNRLVIRQLEAWLRDGTRIAVPEDGALPEIDLKPVLARDLAVTVFLAVPSLRVGRANVSSGKDSEGGRYLIDTEEVEDENTGRHPERMEMRLLNVKLLLATRNEHPGYEAYCRSRASARGRMPTPARDWTPRTSPRCWPATPGTSLRSISCAPSATASVPRSISSPARRSRAASPWRASPPRTRGSFTSSAS